MTTAHRPTFDPARGKEAQRGPAYHQRLQPAHTQLKYRKVGQGGDAGLPQSRDFQREELLAAEAAHFAKRDGKPLPSTIPAKRAIESSKDAELEEDEEARKKRIIAEHAEEDKDDSDASDSDSSDEDDSEDEQAELLRELDKIKRERAEKAAKEEAEKAAQEQDVREAEIAYGNPLLNPKKDFGIQRRWDDDVVFKNQARGQEQKTKKEFVNDLLRSDFHKKFMGKYVR